MSNSSHTNIALEALLKPVPVQEEESLKMSKNVTMFLILTESFMLLNLCNHMFLWIKCVSTDHILIQASNQNVKHFRDFYLFFSLMKTL